MKGIALWKVLLLGIGAFLLCSSCATIFPRRHHPRPPHHEAPPPPPPHRPKHKPHHKHRHGPYRPMAFLTVEEMYLAEAFCVGEDGEA